MRISKELMNTYRKRDSKQFRKNIFLSNTKHNLFDACYLQDVMSLVDSEGVGRGLGVEALRPHCVATECLPVMIVSGLQDIKAFPRYFQQSRGGGGRC